MWYLNVVKVVGSALILLHCVYYSGKLTTFVEVYNAIREVVKMVLVQGLQVRQYQFYKDRHSNLMLLANVVRYSPSLGMQGNWCTIRISCL